MAGKTKRLGKIGSPQGPYAPMGGTMMTPQERNLYQHHARNLVKLDQGGGFTQPSGDVSTVLQRVVGPIKRKYYSIPSVWGGKQLDQDASMRQAFDSRGPDYWPSYPTPEAADERYLKYMHPIMERDLRRGKK